ncbi:hypothetical protein TNCV_3392211 [Trichonephila clavipes]|nr:hypothetical protein TNCV_3392211 [Trichonephila clavipes]
MIASESIVRYLSTNHKLRSQENFKPRLPDLLATTNHLRATPKTVKLRLTPSPSSDFLDMGLRTAFAVQMPTD